MQRPAVQLAAGLALVASFCYYNWRRSLSAANQQAASATSPPSMAGRFSVRPADNGAVRNMAATEALARNPSAVQVFAGRFVPRLQADQHVRMGLEIPPPVAV